MKPTGDSFAGDGVELVAPQHEEAAHRIAERNRQDAPRQRGGQTADRAARFVEGAGAAAFDVAAGGDEVCLAGAQGGQHGGQHAFVMLQVGIHHGDEGRAGRQDAFDAGAGQAAAADTAQAAHARIDCGDRLGGFGRAVGRIVVDEDRFPGDAVKRRVEPAHQFGHIVPLLEGRKDNGQLDPGTRLRRCERQWNGVGHTRLLASPWWP